jgi:DNA-binding NarL/FixJ family response regulator
MSLQVAGYQTEEVDRRDHVRSHREISSANVQVPEPPIRVLVAKIYSLAGNTHPDILLITPKLDDKPCAGLELMGDLRIWHPALKVVVLLESHEKDVVVQSFRLGARGIFSKDSPLRMLIKCIVRVHEGQIWATNEHFGIIVEALSAAHTGCSIRNKPSRLSPRDFR